MNDEVSAPAPTSGTLVLDGVPIAVERDGTAWSVTLGRSLVRVQHDAELDLLTHPRDGLLPCTVTVREDAVTLHVTVVERLRTWGEVVRLPRTERLRALANLGVLVPLADQGIALVLHPENLVVDRNLRPALAYRGLAGAMPPQDEDGMLLRQLRALVLCTFDRTASFDDLVDGAVELRRSSDLERAVHEARTVDDLLARLTEMDEAAAQEEDARTVRVGRRSSRLFRQATVWLGVLVLALGAVCGYQVLLRAPATERLLDADTHFVQGDYDGVIEALRPTAVDDLPATQRYELATSYLHRTDLSHEQRTVIANTLSVSADPDVLAYWIQAGRGELSEALDAAKGIGDVDLVLYALTLLQEQVSADPTLSGTQRQARLRELEEEYDGFLEERAGALGDQPTAASSGPADAG